LKPVLHLWLANLASTIENLTGARPHILPAVNIAANSVPSDLLWWEPDLSGAEMSVWVGIGAPARQALGHVASGAVMNGDPGWLGTEPSYQALLQRSWQGLGGTSGGGRMNSPRQDAQVFRVSLESPGRADMELFAACCDRTAQGSELDRPLQARTGTTLDLLLETDIPLSVHFGSTRMLLQNIVRLSPGSVVDLNRGMDEQVDLVVNGHLVARGDVVSVQGNYALRITAVRERRNLPERGLSPTVKYS
jgi:flagellar motor switch protein FliN/FliY